MPQYTEHYLNAKAFFFRFTFVHGSLRKVQTKKLNPSFSCRLFNLNTPTYTMKKSKINFELNEYLKLIILSAFYRTNMMRLLSTVYTGYIKLYDDGLKRGVGAAETGNEGKRTPTLQRESSMFSGEMRAINMVLTSLQKKDRI